MSKPISQEPKATKNFLQSKKAGGAATGTLVGGLTGTQISESLPPDAPWYAVIVVIGVIALPCIIQIICQSLEDLAGQYKEIKLKNIELLGEQIELHRNNKESQNQAE